MSGKLMSDPRKTGQYRWGVVASDVAKRKKLEYYMADRIAVDDSGNLLFWIADDKVALIRVIVSGLWEEVFAADILTGEPVDKG